ncbi:hypothetical protein Vadar_008088 [Vaccinium darrowii]|uniref:Uncharacterized protein n=1 Tax=Vaccinium darrowii TaxID=229202 RepID=A0ACB7ZI41_9ERIC|nr:hypothetical protein Vadar_008088 [Vaccinium darrowii]
MLSATQLLTWKRKKKGTETIEGLYLDMHHVLEEDSHHVMEKESLFRENFGVSNVKRPRFEELNHESLIAEQGYSLKRRCLSLFTWRPTNKIGRSSKQMYGSNVVEVQGRFKLEPIENANAEIIEKMGLSSELETMGGLEMNLYNQFNAWNFPFKGPLQVLYECGIYNIFLPRSEVPAGWRSNNKRMGSTITFNVPSLPNLMIQALKIYIVFACEYDKTNWDLKYDYITVNNMTKGLKWSYSPFFICIPPVDGMVVLYECGIYNILLPRSEVPAGLVQQQ